MIHSGSCVLGHDVCTDTSTHKETAMARGGISVKYIQLACARVQSQDEKYVEHRIMIRKANRIQPLAYFFTIHHVYQRFNPAWGYLDSISPLLSKTHNTQHEHTSHAKNRCVQNSKKLVIEP